MNEEELREWMNKYHDKWIVAYNKLIDIEKIIEM